MKQIAIEFDSVGKQYRLGRVGTGTLSDDLNRWWAVNVLRKEDPYLKIGEANDRAHKGHSDYVWALKDISFKVEQIRAKLSDVQERQHASGIYQTGK